MSKMTRTIKRTGKAVVRYGKDVGIGAGILVKSAAETTILMPVYLGMVVTGAAGRVYRKQKREEKKLREELKELTEC